MTPDQIKEAAIEAAFKVAHEKGYGIPYLVMRAAIDAYEKAMWRPIEEAPAMTNILVMHENGDVLSGQGVGGGGGEGIFGITGASRIVFYSDLTNFRPLPQPSEGK